MTGETRSPVYKVQISEELRRVRAAEHGLRKGEGSGTSGQTATVDDTVAQTFSALNAAGPVAPLPDPCCASGLKLSLSVLPAEMIRLRCDGRRPFRFNGVPLLSFSARLELDDVDARPSDDVSPGPGSSRTEERTEAPTRSVFGIQHFGLFLTEADSMMAAASIELVGCDSARPIHRAARVATRDDLDRFLLDHCPDDLFGSEDAGSTELQQRRAAIGAALRSEFERLTALCRRPPADPHA